MSSLKFIIGYILFLIFMKAIPAVLLFVACVFVPCYIIYLIGKKICDYYQEKFLPGLRIANMKREFRKPGSPFFGWRYELLVPPLYFPWSEVMRMKPMGKKPWIPKRELYFNNLVPTDIDINSYHWHFEMPGCKHDHFITMHHCSREKYMNLNYKKEGMLHVCLDCQQQIGYSGLGLN